MTQHKWHKEIKAPAEQPTNMVTVPLDKLEDMQRRLKVTQEPVAWMSEEVLPLNHIIKAVAHRETDEQYTIPLYTHPPKEWQTLSDDEIAKLTLYSSEYTNNDGLETISLDEKHFVKAIEAKLKEKNEK